MLPRKINIFSPHKSASWRNSFLRDPKADMIILCGGKILPLHRCRLLESKFLTMECPLTQKVHILDESLNVAMLESVMGYFYGYDITLERMGEFQNFLDIIDLLQIQCLKELVADVLEERVQEFDLFWLLRLVFRFGIHRIFLLCFSYLEFEEFEQINYNKFDLLQCDFTLFQMVLRRHHTLKTKDKISGLSSETIDEVIRSYCSRYNYNQETQDKLLQIYVQSLQGQDFFKPKLLLDNLECKQVSQSAASDNQDGGKGKLEALYQQNQEEKVVPKEEPRKRNSKFRRMSCIVETTTPLFEFSGAGPKKGPGRDKTTIKNAVIEEDPDDERKYEFENSCEGGNSKRRQVPGYDKESQRVLRECRSEKKLFMSNDLELKENESEDSESFLGKVSTLLDHYKDAYQQHEINFSAMKMKNFSKQETIRNKNTGVFKSMIHREINQEEQENYPTAHVGLGVEKKNGVGSPLENAKMASSNKFSFYEGIA